MNEIIQLMCKGIGSNNNFKTNKEENRSLNR